MKGVEHSPALDKSMDSVLARIPYNMIPSKDSIDPEKGLHHNDGIEEAIIPILPEGQKEVLNTVGSQDASRRGSRMGLIEGSKRKSVASESINLQVDTATKTEQEIDVFKNFDIPNGHFRQFLDKMLAHWFFQVLVNAFTVWCLFSDDFRMLFAPMYPGDMVFNIINLVCISLFLFEISMSSIARRQYFFSFFFFMDLISTLIIVFDLTWVQDALM